MALLAGTVGMAGSAYAVAATQTITGTVSNADGGLVGATVTALASNDASTVIATDVSIADGAYTLTVPAGASYVIQYEASGYDEQWYDYEYAFDEADPVAVGQADVVLDDQELDVTYDANNCALADNAGVITGDVYTGAGTATPNPDATITLVDEDSDHPSSRTITPDSSGHFSQDCLYLGGYYTLTISAPGLAAQDFDVYFDEESTADIGQVHLIPGATISGTVSDAITSATKIPGVTVEITNADTENVLATTTTAGDGTYSIADVPNVAVIVHFISTSDDYADQYYKNSSTLGGATTIKTITDKTVDAHLAKARTITGRITGDNGVNVSPQHGVNVTLYTAKGEEVRSTTTNDAGEYVFKKLAADSYKVFASPSSSGDGSTWLSQWYLGKHRLGAAAIITITAKTSAVLKDLKLAAAASISGTVTAGADPAEGYVSVEDLNGSDSESDGDSEPSYTSADINEDGTYSVTGLKPGTYLVHFTTYNDQYIDQYSDDSATEAGATPVVVTAGATVTRNATLHEGGTLSGTVTDGTDPLYGEIGIYTVNGDYVAGTETDDESGGAYITQPLPAGQYLLEFSADGYADEYWNDATTLATATPVTVSSAGDVSVGTTVLTALPDVPAGTASVSGVVTDSAGVPLEDIDVYILSKHGFVAEPTQTDVDGNYTFAGLSAGSYTVAFGVFSEKYVAEFWKNQPLTTTKPTFFTVKDGAVVTAKNASLALAGSISGDVINPAGTDEDYVDVDVYNAKGVRFGLAGGSDSEGSGYLLGGLPAGSYKVVAYADSDSGSFGDTWYGQKTSFASAKTIVVKPGLETEHKDITLVKSGGAVSGVVTSSADKLPIDAADLVILQRGPDGRYGEYRGAETDGTGAYAFRQLPAGTYKVEAGSWGGYRDQYYSKKSSLKSATVITVKSGKTTKLKTVALTPLAQPVQFTVPKLTAFVGAGAILSPVIGTKLPATSVKFSYQWLRDGHKITGATKSSYKATAADVNHQLTVRVTGSKPGYSSTTRVSTSTLVKPLA